MNGPNRSYLRTHRAALAGLVLVMLAFCSLAVAVPAQQAQAPAATFTGAEAMVAMRDGARLYTQIYTPAQVTQPLPILFLRTPYSAGPFNPARIAASMPELASEGFIFVLQDIRGRFKSEGQFVMLRQPRDAKDPNAIDESTDTYDTIEWLLKNVSHHNGRVGMAGTSYGAWLTVMGMLDPHPALKAAVPQASPADMWIGDDFHHNGAFRLSYGFEYVYRMESSKEMASPSEIINRYDTYEWYLELGPLSNADGKYLHGRYPSWNDFVNHPDYDDFWKRQAFAPWLNRVTVPTLNVAGWWDQEDFYGPIKIYELLERHDARNMNFLVVGPWNHGGWSRGEGRTLGRVNFGSATAESYRRDVLVRFLAYYLKDKGTWDVSEALTFRTGANQWQRHDTWPPRSASERKLYFHPNGKLSFDPPGPEIAGAFDSYVSDPAHPVPYRPRPIRLGAGWSTWLVEDQRFVHRRPDVLTWVSEPLEEDVVVSGKVIANLYASTSGTDSDWIVKLIDVHAEKYAADPTMSGYQLMIGGDVFRGRYQKSFEKPEPLSPGAVMHYPIPYHATDHTFRKGHRIMVQVHSTWFPVIDRNPQTFVPNIFHARESDFQPATQRVFRSRQYPSHISLPVVSQR